MCIRDRAGGASVAPKRCALVALMIEAFISSFLGKQLTDLLDHIEKADKEELLDVYKRQGWYD